MLRVFSVRMFLRLVAVACFGLAIAGGPAGADDYPSKPVRVIVPFAPGGINDILARVVSAQLSERLGKQFVVENKTGAGGIVGSELVAKSAPDGYTLLIVSIAHAVNPALYKLPYDPLKAFAPISIFASSPNVLAIYPGLPAKDLKEFVALAKSQPGEIQYGSGGVGGSPHLGMELFKRVAGIDLTHVPFRGSGPAVIDVTGGHTKAIMATVTTLSPHVKSGKLRALGVSGKTRNHVLPDVPTMDEAGVPGYTSQGSFGLFAPAGTPRDIRDKIATDVAEVLSRPDVKKALEARSFVVTSLGPDAFDKYIASENVKWEAVIKRAGIKGD